MRRLIITCILMMTLAACGRNQESVIAFSELPETGDAANGEILFAAQACSGCHMEGATGAPNLDGYGERASSTIEGESAREYTFYSIVEPARHITEGFGNAMPNNYDENMTAQEIADLIAYLLSR